MLKIVVCSEKKVTVNFEPESGDIICFVTGSKEDHLEIPVETLAKMAACKEVRVREAGGNDPVNIAFELGRLVEENKGKDYKVYSNMKQLDCLGQLEKSSAKTARKPRIKQEKTVAQKAAQEAPAQKTPNEQEEKEPVVKKEKPVARKEPAAASKKEPRTREKVAVKEAGETKWKGSAIPRKFAKDEAEVKKLLMENGISANYAKSIYDAMQGASDVTLEMNVRMKLAEQGVGQEIGNKILNALVKKYLA